MAAMMAIFAARAGIGYTMDILDFPDGTDPMTRISAWGNSHGVRLARDVLERAGIAPDAEVVITAEPGRIVIAPARHAPTLDELLARIRPGQRFDEVDYGPPRGREVL